VKRTRLAVLAVWIAALLACAAVIARTEISTDLSAFLPRSPSPAQQVLVDQVREGAVSRLILLAIEGAPADALAALSRDLAARLRHEPALSAVDNGEEATLDAEREFIWRNRYVLSPAVVPARFTAAGLREALQRDQELLSSGLGALVKRTLPSDPTGEMLTIIDQFVGESPPHTSDGLWFAPDDSRALLMVQTRAAGFDIDGQQQALQRIEDAFRGAQQGTPGAASAHLLETGPGVFAVHTRATTQEDAERLSLIATVLIAGVLLSAYRSALLLVLGFVPVLCGAVAGIAAVSLGFGFVHGITLGFGVTLMGESVDYAIYLFTQTAPARPPAETLTRIWPTLVLGALTSVAGFSAMLLSSFAGFAQLGLLSITGLIVALATTRWLLPALLPRGFTAVESRLLAHVPLAVMRRAHRLRLPLLAAVLAAIALLCFHRGGYWQEEITSLSPIPLRDQQLDQRLRRDVGAPDLRYLVVVTAASERAALEASERLSSELRAMVDEQLLADFDAPDRYLPSERTQRLRRAALPDAETLRGGLQEALDGLGFRADLFAPFLADVAAARDAPPVQRADVPPRLALKLGSLLFERHGAWVAALPLRGVADAARVAERIGVRNENGIVFVDLKAESDRLLQTYQREAVLLSLIGSLVITVLLAIGLRSAARVFFVMAPLAASVVLTLALLTAGGGKLSIFNLVGLLLIVAVGSNYCLFFERQKREDEQVERTLASLVLANLCTVIGFGVLSFSRIPVLHDIGMTVAVGAAFSLFFGAIVNARGVAGASRDVSRTSGNSAP
jgi:predicted exporter